MNRFGYCVEKLKCLYFKNFDSLGSIVIKLSPCMFLIPTENWFNYGIPECSIFVYEWLEMVIRKGILVLLKRFI